MTRLTAPKQLSDHLYIVYAEFPHRDSGNIYLVTGRSPTLIDCGSRRAVPHLLRNLDQLGVAVSDLTRIIATHGDCDHIQGFHDLRLLHPALRLHIHPADWPLVLESDPYRNANYLYRNPFVPLLAEHCVPLADGETIAAGDCALMVHHTPGHTEGSVCLWGEIDGHKVLFAGDTVGGAMRSLNGADLRLWAQAALTWERSLERIAGLDIDWVLNGHEPAHGLPLSRARFDRAVGSFGKMMSPWFLLDEQEDEEPVETVAEALQETG
jgi:glyoxylase-like metal-dependent hydrolase (beta-lactamase superfamily II)